MSTDSHKQILFQMEGFSSLWSVPLCNRVFLCP